MKTELFINVFHSEPLPRKIVQSYVRDAVASFKGGLMPGNVCKGIQRATFKKQNPISAEKAELINTKLLNALAMLVLRFPIEGYAIDGKCKCLQYEDHGTCRHLIAQKIVETAGML